MLNKKLNAIKFKFGVFKVKYSHMRLMKHYLKTLKFCIYHMVKIGIPVSDGEKMLMEALLSVYDETIMELNKNVDVHRKRIDHIKE